MLSGEIALQNNHYYHYQKEDSLSLLMIESDLMRKKFTLPDKNLGKRTSKCKCMSSLIHEIYSSSVNYYYKQVIILVKKYLTIDL